jgi:hypothetical protein
MDIKPGFMFEEEAANSLRALIEGGKLGAGVFNVNRNNDAERNQL